MHTKQCTLKRHGLRIAKMLISDELVVSSCCYNRLLPGESYDVDTVDCRVCLDQEDHNIVSYRQGANSKYSLGHNSSDLFVLDLTPNINCNATCKTCGERSSSSWAKLKGIPIHSNPNVSVNELLKILDAYNLSSLQEINFSGGEPLLNQNIIDYLLPLKSRVNFKNLTLRFSTNGTILPDSRLLNFLSEFKSVAMRFSLDDVHLGHEYIRYPSKWADWENCWNVFLKQLPRNVNVSINRTVSLLNINRLELLHQWIKAYDCYNIDIIDHFANGPTSLNFLTKPVKDLVLDTGGDLAKSYIENRQCVSDCSTLLNNIIYNESLQPSLTMEQYNPTLYKALFNP